MTQDPNGAAPGSYVAVHLADVPADVAMRLVQRVQAASQVPSLLTAAGSCWQRITVFAISHMHTYAHSCRPFNIPYFGMICTCVMQRNWHVPHIVCMRVVGCMTACYTVQTCMPFFAGIHAGLLAYHLKSTMQHLVSNKSPQPRSRVTNLLIVWQHEGPA